MRKHDLSTVFKAACIAAFIPVLLQGCGGGSSSDQPEPVPSSTPTSAPTPTPTPTSTPSATPSSTPSPTVSPSASPTPTPSPESGNVRVDVTVNMKHQVGDEYSFDRSKYITYHASINDNEWPSDEVRDAFFEDYDVYLGRTNGGLPWQLSRLESTAVDGRISLTEAERFGTQTKGWYKNFYASDAKAADLEARSANMMQGGQMIMYPHNENKMPCPRNPCNNTNKWLADYDELGKYFSAYLTHYFGTGGNTGEPKPKYIEVLNEPMWNSGQYQTNNSNISELHSVVAKAIKKDHSDVKVGGYTAAWPGIEEDNFGKFDDTWKTFIDIAGADMDFYSIHFYDGHDSRKHTYRSGANIEAVLDTIDQYSILETGSTRPWIVSEYGFFSPTELEDVGYSKLRDWYNLRSYSSMMMSFLERPDQIISAIPFSILKALWFGNNGMNSQGFRYGPRLFVLEGELNGAANVADNGKWVYSELLKWYQLWADVKGTRVDSHASDLDIQVDSYVDGKNLYLIVNNLEIKAQTVDINLAETHGVKIEKITSKHLFYDKVAKTPVLDEVNQDVNMSSFTVDANSTAVFHVVYESDISIDQNSQEVKYFANSNRQAITANTALSFAVNGVDTSSVDGEAVLRVAIGRNHTLSKAPSISINNVALSSMGDVRGYYENNPRDEFFGILEIPVPYSALAENNSIVVSFPDSGGTVSSVALQVFSMSQSPARTNK